MTNKENEILQIKEFSKKYDNDWKYYWIKKYEIIINEYLQTKIIEFIGSMMYRENLILIWGTSIRLLRDWIRTSKDLDYDAENINKEMLTQICYDIKNFLEWDWYTVSILPRPESISEEDLNNQKVIECSFVISNVFNFDWIWEEFFLSEVNLSISMDIKKWIWDYNKEDIIPTKSINNIPVRTARVDSLLSKKISWFLSRSHFASVAKDITDIIFLLEETYPDFEMLKEYEYIYNNQQLLERVFNKINNIPEEQINISNYRTKAILLDKRYEDIIYDSKSIISDLLNYYK